MNKYNIFLRIFILSTPFWVPWWLVLILGLSALFWFEKYWEIIFIGIILDTIYSTSYTIVGPYIFTLASLICFWGSLHIKQRLIVY